MPTWFLAENGEFFCGANSVMIEGECKCSSGRADPCYHGCEMNPTRRSFLHSTAVMVPVMVPASVLGQAAPSNKIKLAAWSYYPILPRRRELSLPINKSI